MMYAVSWRLCAHSSIIVELVIIYLVAPQPGDINTKISLLWAYKQFAILPKHYSLLMFVISFNCL